MLPQKFLASLFTGRAIPVTSAASFDRLMTSINLAIDTRARDVIAVVAENRLVDRNNVLGAAEPEPIAFMNPGGFRADLRHAGNPAGDGNVSYGEAFTGRQIHDLPEQQRAADRLSRGRILQVVSCN